MGGVASITTLVVVVVSVKVSSIRRELRSRTATRGLESLRGRPSGTGDGEGTL